MNKAIGIAMLTFLACGQVQIAMSESVQAQSVQDRKTEVDKLVELGEHKLDKGLHQEALQSYQSALNLYRLIKNQKGEVTALIGLGDVYESLQQFQKALEFFQQALDISKQIGDRLGEAKSLNGYGSAYASHGNSQKTQKALEFFQQSLAISKQIGDRLGEVKALNGLGFVYGNLGQFQKGIDYYQQSATLAKLIGERKYEADALFRIGLIFYLAKDYRKLIDYSQASLEIYQQINNRKGQAISLFILGEAYNSLGYYQKALDYNQQSLTISKQIGNGYYEASSLRSMVGIYRNLGQYQKMIDFFQQSLVIYKKMGNRYGEGATLGDIGAAYNVLKQPQKAIEYYQQSIVIAKQMKALHTEGSALNGLGSSYKDLGDYQKALASYQQGLNIFTQNKLLGDDYEIGDLLNNLGVVNSLLGQNQTAIVYYQQSLAIFKQLSSRKGEADTLNNLGKLFAKLKQPELAILFYKQSVNLRESIRKDIRGLSKEEQKSYLATVEETYRNLADLLLKQDRILEAHQVLDLLKVEELNEYLKTVRGNAQTSQGVDLQRPEQNIIALATELTDLQQKDRENKLSETEQQRLAQLVQTERDQNKQFNSFLNSPEIKKLITELRRVEEQQNLNLASYRKLQKDVLTQVPNAVLLYPLILDDRLELIIINAKTPPLRRTVKIKREQLNQEIVDFLSDLRDSGSEDVKVPAKKLYKLLIQPFETELQELKIDTIIYAPDGQLRYIPLSALHDGKQWLVEKYRINNITAESLTSFAPKPLAKPHIFAGAFGGKSGVKTQEGFIGLPATITEVQKIASLFPNTTTFTEAAFSKQITATKANSHTILHLATHGQLSVGTPEDSFILFGNGEKATIREIQDWSLSNVDLVILSACQSGIGSKLGTGVEILGLGYQMQAAGARVAIASLWKVDDTGTQALMTAFYSELQKGDVTVTEALRRAQVSLIKSPQYNHPNYWSAFFAIGNGL
jgi:CHAT domain-containing protein/tetratricopeptide (TPR) repeat protein